jgi:hypothetical protein
MSQIDYKSIASILSAADEFRENPIVLRQMIEICCGEIHVLRCACRASLDRLEKDGWPLNDANTRAIRQLWMALEKP